MTARRIAFARRSLLPLPRPAGSLACLPAVAAVAALLGLAPAAGAPAGPHAAGADRMRHELVASFPELADELADWDGAHARHPVVAHTGPANDIGHPRGAPTTSITDAITDRAEDLLGA
jgi:hypothetical protein